MFVAYFGFVDRSILGFGFNTKHISLHSTNLTQFHVQGGFSVHYQISFPTAA